MSSATLSPAQTVISEQSVADYLVANPDFFRRHPGVLSDMALPHHSGNATSLIERQVAILRERSMQTRHKLGELIEAAKDNDALFNTTQALVLELLKAKSLHSLFTTMEQQLLQQFSVESASILLLSDSSNIAVTTHANTLADTHFARSLADAKNQITALIDNSRSLCGTLREHESAFIFAHAKRAIGSAAIASRSITIGPDGQQAMVMLAVAHHDPSHYGSNTGTLFLDYLCDITSVLVQNSHQPN